MIKYEGSDHFLKNNSYSNYLAVTPDDQHFYLSDGKVIYLYNADSVKMIRKYQGASIHFDNFNKVYTVFRGSKSYTYKLDDHALVYRQDMSKEALEFVKRYKKSNKEIIIDPLKYLPSATGNFVLMPFHEKSSDEGNMAIMSTQRSDVKELAVSGIEGDVECMQFNDSIILLFSEKENKRLLISDTIYINNFLGSRESLKKQVFNPDVSSVLEKKVLSSGFRVRSALHQDEVLLFKGAHFVSFIPGTEDVIVTKNEKMGVLNASGMFRPFNDSLMAVIENAVEDMKPPEDYNSYRIESFRHISSRNDSSAALNLVLKNLEVDDSTVSLNVHLIDDHGVYYYGASEDSFLNVWCNLIITDRNGPQRQITDFHISEHRSEQDEPRSVALVLDHSGSMGEERVIRLQKASERFIERKAPADAISIIKYDSKIGVESGPETDIEKLKKRLKVNGFGRYGRSTSLLDAANAGISVCRKKKGMPGSIVLLTDGAENSSVTTYQAILRKAVMSNVRIHTIGYGAFVDKAFLSSLSDKTDGSFYMIYNQSDFDWIFDDIYRKQKNYYQVKFKVDEIGKYITILKICDEKFSDELKVEFEKVLKTRPTSLKDLEKILASSANSFIDSVDMEIKVEDIKDFSGVTTDFRSKPKIGNVPVEMTDVSDIDAEFEKLIFPDIKFVFDQTEIIKGSEKYIENVVAFMKKHPKVRVEIGGHTDSDGDEDYNMELSLDRAIKVKQLLISMGVEEYRLIPKGYGEDHPIVTEDSEQNRLKNRRVEFHIIH